MHGRPESTTVHIFRPRVPLRVEDSSAIVVGIIVSSLQRPLPYKNRKNSIPRKSGSLAAYSGGDVLRIDACISEVVDVSVDGQVRTGVEVRRPCRLAAEAVLKHDGDLVVEAGDAIEDEVDVGRHPRFGWSGEAIAGAEG